MHWLGVLSDEEVASRLAGADVLSAPSLQGESFGMVLLEGMAAGCTVVASDIEGYRRAAGGHASLVAPGDAGRRWPGPSTVRWTPPPGHRPPRPGRRATEYARAWSMETLARRYVDVYTRAIEAYGARG